VKKGEGEKKKKIRHPKQFFPSSEGAAVYYTHPEPMEGKVFPIKKKKKRGGF